MFSAYLATQPPTATIWNSLFTVYATLGIAAGVIVISYLIFNILKYRRKGKDHSFHEEGEWGNWKKVILTLAITGSVLGFVQYQTYNSIGLIIPPEQGSLHINVIARQFSWTFVYPNGAEVIGNLTVPVGETIILNVTSIDVTHSFAVDNLRVAVDAIPGRYNILWFSSPETGVHTIRCKELCGIGHAFMLGKVTFVEPAAYERWYSSLGGK
jgi:cytochrome c oxidase subunit 2